jgi:hypothetical protein
MHAIVLHNPTSGHGDHTVEDLLETVAAVGSSAAIARPRSRTLAWRSRSLPTLSWWRAATARLPR